jgi:DNA-binding PadR family transcriptional regulator
LTNAELAILSLVVEQPRHGYEIEQVIVQRNMRDWTDIGFSSIYYVLGKLETAGLVTSRREPAPGRGPQRRVYAATDEGAAVLRERALEAIAGPARRHSSFQLGLSVLPSLDASDVGRALEAHRRDLEARLDVLHERATEELPFHVTAMFDLAETQIEAELAWISRFSADFHQHPRPERTP